MSRRRSRFVGYFAYASATEVVCNGDACVISGTRRAMEEFISEIDPGGRKARTIKKTTFDEIERGLLHGAAYAFDKVAYRRFYSLARQSGRAIEREDLEKPEDEDFGFFVVQLRGL